MPYVVNFIWLNTGYFNVPIDVHVHFFPLWDAVKSLGNSLILFSLAVKIIFLGKTVEVFVCLHAKSLQLCLTLWDLIECSLPGFCFHGLLQTRILEWVVISCSRGSPQPRDGIHLSCLLHWQVGSLLLEPAGKPIEIFIPGHISHSY